MAVEDCDRDDKFDEYDIVQDFIRRFDSFVTELSLIPADKLKDVVGIIDERLGVIKNEIYALADSIGLDDNYENEELSSTYVIEETETVITDVESSEEILVTVHDGLVKSSDDYEEHEHDVVDSDHEYGVEKFKRPQRQRFPNKKNADFVVDENFGRRNVPSKNEDQTVTVTDESGATMKATINTDGSFKVVKLGKENKNIEKIQATKFKGRPLDCKLCPIKFEKRKDMQDHYKKVHPGASPWNWPCNLCQVNFEKKKQLTEHYKHVHPTESKPLVNICEKCDKTFASNQGLQFHMETRHPSEPRQKLSCPEEDCPYVSYSRECLRSHRNSAHNQQRGPYKCPVCNKEYFGGQKKFREHMKLHTGELNFACEICGKRFVSSNRLQYHIKNVHGDAKYKCDVCGKDFKAKVNYQRHILVHTKDKPFKCHICDFACNTSGNLTVHVRGVHKVKGFTTGSQDKQKRKDILTKRFIKSGPSVVNENGEQVSIPSVDALPEVLGNIETSAYLEELSYETNSKVSLEELKEVYKEPDLVRKPSRKSKKPKRKKLKQELEQVYELEEYRQHHNINTLGEHEYFHSGDQAVTLTNEKGEVIKALISIGGTVEVEAMEAEHMEVVEEGVLEDGVVEHVMEGCMDLGDFSGEVVVDADGFDVGGEVMVAQHSLPQVVVEQRSIPNPVRIQAVKRMKAPDGTVIYQHF